MIVCERVAGQTRRHSRQTVVNICEPCQRTPEVVNTVFTDNKMKRTA